MTPALFSRCATSRTALSPDLSHDVLEALDLALGKIGIFIRGREVSGDPGERNAGHGHDLASDRHRFFLPSSDPAHAGIDDEMHRHTTLLAEGREGARLRNI